MRYKNEIKYHDWLTSYRNLVVSKIHERHLKESVKQLPDGTEWYFAIVITSAMQLHKNCFVAKYFVGLVHKHNKASYYNDVIKY